MQNSRFSAKHVNAFVVGINPRQVASPHEAVKVKFTTLDEFVKVCQECSVPGE